MRIEKFCDIRKEILESTSHSIIEVNGGKMEKKKIIFNFIILASLFIALSIANNEIYPIVVEGPRKQPPNTCEKLPYTFKVEQIDEKGYRCEGTITVNACYGRCQSKEISDWKFPFKRAHHPVCVTFSGVSKVVTTLTNCDAEADMSIRRYEYTEPIDCTCRLCSSSNTSCESPGQLTHNRNPMVKLVAAPIIETDDYEENLDN